MITSTQDRLDEVDASPPQMTPEQALLRLVELIRTSRRLGDFTPEKVGQVMGVGVKPSGSSPGDYSFYERASNDWMYGFDFNHSYRRFVFSFDPIDSQAHPSMKDICTYDFDKFSGSLVEMGFSRTPIYGEHGRLMNYSFDRFNNDNGGMRVEVYPRGEANVSSETIRHDCIQMIYIY